VDRHHEVQAGQDRREAGDEDAEPVATTLVFDARLL
jgi:hypothetical protein